MTHPLRLCAGLLCGAALLTAAWIGVDLSRPARADLRVFDAGRVATVETQMWRSYYEHRRLRLFGQLSQLLRRQYDMPYWRSKVAAYHAARAAAVFQRGRERSERMKALPHLEEFYRLVERSSAGGPFDARRAAELELEWWMIHRERARHTSADLEAALAALQAEIYRQPAAVFQEHAAARAKAMLLRDELAAAAARAPEEGMTEQEWAQVDRLLHDSWRALHEAVAPPRREGAHLMRRNRAALL